jgi:peptidyl-prolyl cis-trans isomerase D
MVMEMMRKGAAGGLGKFILMGFMALAVGGLVLMDMGGFFRGGVSSGDVVKIASHTISARSFDQTVRRALAQVNLSPAQAYKMGFIDRILRSEIGSAVLGIAAHDSGIVISDELAAKHIGRMVAPMAGPNGDIKETLDRILVSQGMSEAAFVGGLKTDMRNALYAGALEDGFAVVSDDLAQDLYRAQNQKRDVSYINFKHTDIDDIAPPTEEQLQGLYSSVKEQFATPALRNLKIIALDTAALKSKIDISDDALKARYEEEKDFYAVRESWTLEQALVDDPDTANRIYEQVQNGTALSQAVIEVTGNEMTYLGEKPFEAPNLPEAAKDEITAQKHGGGVLTPINTPLGVRIIRIRAYTPEGVQPFENVKDEIKKDVYETQLIDQMYEQASIVDDLLAGGASVKDLKTAADVNVTDVNNVTMLGGGDFGDLEDLRQDILHMIEDLGEGETSPMQEMSDGRFMSVLVDGIIPKSYRPFEEARAQLEEKWTTDQQLVSNRMRVKQMIGKVKDVAMLKTLAQNNGKNIHQVNDIVRGAVKNDLPIHTVQNLFAAEPAQPIMIDTKDGYALAIVTNVIFSEDIPKKELSIFKEELGKQRKNEVTMLFLNHKRDEYGVKVNEQTLEHLYGGSSAE